MIARKHLYWAAGAVISMAVVVGGIAIMTKDEAKPTKSTPISNTRTDDQVEPIKGSDIKTPTDNGALTNTLNDDANAIDTDVKNAENDDYSDNILSDSSLYN